MFDLRGIGFDGLKRRGDDFEFDVLADDFVEEAHEAAGDCVEVDRLRLENLPAGKSEEFSRECGGALGLLADAREAVGNLRIALVLLEAKLRPAKDGPDDIVEVVCDATRELPDGFEFLSLPQLALYGSEFRDILGDDFDRISLTRDGNAAETEPHGHQAPISPLPFAFGAVNGTILTTVRRELCPMFWKTENVTPQVDRAEFLDRSKAQHGKQSRIGIVEGAVERGPKDAVWGVIDQILVARFTIAQLLLSAHFTLDQFGLRLHLFLMKGFLADGALQRGGQPRKAFLQDVIAYSCLYAIDGGLLAERSRDQQKGNVLAGCTKLSEGIDARPAWQAKVGKNGFKFAGLERAHELLPVLHERVAGVQPRFF